MFWQQQQVPQNEDSNVEPDINQDKLSDFFKKLNTVNI